jgi:hypothetical protein
MPKSVFDEMAAPVPEIMDDTLYILIQHEGKQTSVKASKETG